MTKNFNKFNLFWYSGNFLARCCRDFYLNLNFYWRRGNKQGLSSCFDFSLFDKSFQKVFTSFIRRSDKWTRWNIKKPKFESNSFPFSEFIRMNIFFNLKFISLENSIQCQVITFKWRLVGCIYWPNVTQSTPILRKSFIVWIISSSDSPRPSIRDVFVSRPGGPVFFACSNVIRDCL